MIGTPVPAVIATDYLALKRMSEKKIKLPILTVDTDGMELYDKGEEKAFLELFKTFAVEKYPIDEQRIGILGMIRRMSATLMRQIKYGICFSKNTDRKQSVTVWEMDCKK